MRWTRSSSSCQMKWSPGDRRGAGLLHPVTCTPTGQFPPLLVRGHRIDNLENAGIIRVTADALQIDPIIIAPLVAVPILLVLLVVLLVSNGKKHKK